MATSTTPGKDDFIVVEEESAPPSKPDDADSASPEINLSHSPTADSARKTSRLSSSQRRPDGGFNDTLDPLRALPELRPIPWYPGKELPTEKSTESSRVQTRGACLLASRGNIVVDPCSHCKTGVGRFSKCIALEDWFHGACATCQLATRGNLCSLRREKEIVKPENETEPSQEDTPAVPMPPSSQSQKKKSDSSRTSVSKSHITTKHDSQTETRQPATIFRQTSESGQQVATSQYSQTPQLKYGQNSSTLKRKRETLQGTSVWRPYVSPYAPLDPPNRLSSSLPNTPSSAPNMIIPTNVTRSQFAPVNAPVNYIQQRQGHHNGVKPHNKVTQAPPPPSTAVQGNKHAKPPVAIDTRRSIIEEPRRERTESLSPSAQLLQPLQSPTPEPPTHTTRSESRRNATRDLKGKSVYSNGTAAPSNPRQAVVPPETALFDSLPRRKKKQLLGIIGGLQIGIRECRQQADSMQKQLDLLQSTLGLEVEEDNDVSMSVAS